MRMGRSVHLALLATVTLTWPSHAFEVEDGACRPILSGQARVRIHYTSGLKVELEPVDRDNVTSEIDVFPDGKRVPQKWVGGGGLLPLENPNGRFAYIDTQATRLSFEPGETRQLPFTYTSAGGRTASGTIELTVEEVKRAAFGACQATFVTVKTSTNWADAKLASRIVRLYVKELGFFIASTVDRMKDGKLETVTFRATRVELMR
jgi:hypothetical protein